VFPSRVFQSVISRGSRVRHVRVGAERREIESLFRERSGKYREMDGLLQKFYLHDEESGRVGGTYVFDSAASRDALFDSDVHASLRDAYAVRSIDIETYHVLFPLYDTVGIERD
jgi:heme-degrading monooxygenase HmoA